MNSCYMQKKRKKNRKIRNKIRKTKEITELSTLFLFTVW